MTPGYARPRSELPWLPYESLDRVIINSHNFTPAGPTGIGGEIAWWCPSLDDSGNGTATMNDLIGSRNCSLTAEATPANAWGVDTDNGGVRAVLFNGMRYWDSGDRFTEIVGKVAVSFSFWLWRSSAFDHGVIGQSQSGGNYANIVRISTTTYFQITPSFPSAVTSGTQWEHFGMVLSASTIKGYRNGVEIASGPGPSAYPSIAANFLIGYYAFSPMFSTGKKDDIRIFDRGLSDFEMVALASQRGYQP